MLLKKNLYKTKTKKTKNCSCREQQIVNICLAWGVPSESLLSKCITVVSKVTEVKGERTRVTGVIG